MEKSDVNNESNTYVSCYPNTRRYSLANAMATNRPLYRTDNQGYSIDGGCDEDVKEKTPPAETKIDMPASQPPQYSAFHEKMGDKKVKVCWALQCLKQATEARGETFRRLREIMSRDPKMAFWATTLAPIGILVSSSTCEA
jgi:hypothetical protein